MTPAQHEADPAGDLVLSVGLNEDRQLIRVSSKVLTLASPVLSALLSPKFTEGRSLADSTGVLQIPFPEDNPEAMVWLCQALHFKKRPTDEVSFPLVKDLAILCDKYDLSIALGSWSEVWMQKWRGSVQGVDRFPQMLWISYALDNQDRFWETSRKLRRVYTSKDVVLARKELTNGILPDPVLDSINHDRERFLAQLQTTIETSIVSLVEKGCPHSGNHEVNGTICNNLAEAGHCLSELVRLGLWPTSKFSPQTNLFTISRQVLNFNNYNKDNPNSIFSSNGYYTKCPGGKTDFRSVLGQLVSEAVVGQQGMCLRCVKQGKVTEEEGNCHAAHVHLCTS